MKKFLALCSLAVPLVVAVPASAGDTNNNAPRFEDVLRALVLSQFGGDVRSSDRGYARHHVHARDHARTRDQGQRWRDERRVIPIARLVRQIQRETGGRVTSVRLRRNGRVYRIEGVGPRGGAITAKANAYTGEIFDVQRRHGAGHGYQAVNGKPIPRILRGLRGRGYYGFDRVVREGRTYTVRGLNSRGTPVRIVANARNGHVISVNQARRYNGPAHYRQPVQGFGQWRSGLQQQHYSRFGQATRVDDYYQVAARDRRGRNVQLRVCARTGRVLHSAYL